MLGKDKNILILTILCIAFLLIIGGVSYAFLSQVFFSEQKLETIVGTLAIEYKDKKGLHLDGIYPMSDEKGMMTSSYEFSVENTGDVKALYDISLEEDQSTMNHSFLKYSLKRNNEEWSEPKVLDSLKLKEQIELDVGAKDNYELKMWMDEKVGNEGKNKVFKARVVISSVQSNASSKDVTPPVIKLKGSLSESIEQNKEYVDAGVESIVDDKDTLNKEDVVLTYEYYDGESTKEVENIDTSKLGVYYITYTISDKSGNIGKIIRSVNIYKKNTTPPVIRLNGNNLIAVKRGEAYSELGASASSGEVDLTSRIVTVGKVNTNKSGNYEIKYLITDNDGNTASIVRVVNVIHITSEIKADIQLDLTNRPTDKINLEGENLGDITYTSSDPDIVTVDENGNVEGKNPGTVTITITTSTGHKETITITVKKTINIAFEKSTGISSISKTSDTCEITEKNGSCHVTLPTIEGAKGYTVSGWYDGEAKVGNANDSVTVTGNKTYTAKANAKTYTIIYHSNGGSGEMSSQTVKAGESVSIKTNSFTKEGYTFAGWTTNSNGSDDGHNWTSFNGTWNFDNGDKGITENKLNLYARWSINSYDVTYNYSNNGGSSATKTSAKVNYNSAIDLTPTATKSGWTFVGWNTNKDATSALSSLTMKTSNVTLYAIFRKEAITRTVNFNANGNTINATSKSCTIAAVYNNATQEANCSVTTPVITAPTNTPSIVGYNQSASATSSQVGSNASLTITSSINGKTYYAITKKDGKTITITFNKNGASTQTNASGTAVGDATVTRSCNIATVYNNATQASSCNVTSPTIVGSTNTPTVIGYSTAATTHGSSWNHNTSKAVSSNTTYYAQTKKDAVTRTITYSKSSGVRSIGKESDSCTIAATYNGTSQAAGCNVTLPSITSKTGYDTGFWSTSSTATSGTSTGTSISLSGNTTYYAIARDTTKPVWSLVGVFPSSGSSESLTITFTGTDTSGSVTSSLATSDIIVKVGGTTVSPSIKKLSGASNTINGKQYILTLSDFSKEGIVSIVIGANTLTDTSNNKNVETTLTTAVRATTTTFSFKHFIVIGEKDGVPSSSMSRVIESMYNSDVVYTIDGSTGTALGVMNFEVQKRIKEIVEQYGAKNVVVVLGTVDEYYAEDYALTVTTGDPTYSGALAGVPLRLNVYHIFDPEIKNGVDSSVWDEYMALYEAVFSDVVDELVSVVQTIREENSDYL